MSWYLIGDGPGRCDARLAGRLSTPVNGVGRRQSVLWKNIMIWDSPFLEFPKSVSTFSHLYSATRILHVFNNSVHTNKRIHFMHNLVTFAEAVGNW
jgi:hypothetical protein